MVIRSVKSLLLTYVWT